MPQENCHMMRWLIYGRNMRQNETTNTRTVIFHWRMSYSGGIAEYGLQKVTYIPNQTEERE